jgi:hypothetical protein
MRYRGEPYPRTISITSTLIGLHLEPGGELFEQEEDNTVAAEGKRESRALRERFEEQEEEMVL